MGTVARFITTGMISLIVVNLTACSTARKTTFDDSDVKVVTDLDRSKCKDMGTAIGESAVMTDERKAAESAMKEAQKRAGTLGANRFVPFGSVYFSRKAEGEVIASATGQAWRCEE